MNRVSVGPSDKSMQFCKDYDTVEATVNISAGQKWILGKSLHYHY